MTGICALCIEKADLKDSHLLPKSLYRLMRIKGPKNVSPVLINSSTAWNTDNQFRKHLLCGECESRFHANGEDWALRHIYRGPGSFKLFDILTSSAPFATRETDAVFAAANIPAINVPKLSYFAMSVFWRAAATTWSLDGQALAGVSFGARYQEAMRRYLLAESDFPENVVLQIQVANTRDEVLLGMIAPYGENAGGYHRYRFFVPGVAFYLFLGQKIPSDNRRICFVRSPEHLLALFDYE